MTEDAKQRAEEMASDNFDKNKHILNGEVMTDQDLKACPMCGTGHTQQIGSETYLVEAKFCRVHCECGLTTANFKTPEEAIAAWNTRHADSQRIRDLREQTGAGMLDCKKALEKCGGNWTNSINWLKWQGTGKEKQYEISSPASNGSKEG